MLIPVNGISNEPCVRHVGMRAIWSPSSDLSSHSIESFQSNLGATLPICSTKVLLTSTEKLHTYLQYITYRAFTREWSDHVVLVNDSELASNDFNSCFRLNKACSFCIS
jgi:hypothetical protein